jgi:hypothetical protein
MAGRTRKQKPLWRCPKCGHWFVTRNLAHSCARYQVVDHLKGKSPQIARLYRKFAALVRRCGPVMISPNKTRIAFMARMRFAGCRMTRDTLHVGFLLNRRLRNRRIRCVEYIPPYYYVHHLPVRTPGELDRELLGWLREAYKMGQQEHLKR